MSREHDQFDSTWDNNEGNRASRTFRDGYLNGGNQNRPRQRSNDQSQDVPPSSPGRAEKHRQGSSPGGGRIYEESDERPSQRPRLTRQSHDEALARLRQRPRQPIYSREPEKLPPPQPPARRNQEREIPRRSQSNEQPDYRRTQDDEYSYEQTLHRPEDSAKASASAKTNAKNSAKNNEYTEPPRRATRHVSSDGSQYTQRRAYEDYEDDGEYEPGYPRRRHHGHSKPPHRGRGRGGRWSIGTFLLGCLGGLVTLALIAVLVFYFTIRNTPLGQSIGKSTYTHVTSQTLTLSNVTQVIVNNQIGNVTINVDPSANSASLVSTRKVLAGSQSEANTAFNQMALTNKILAKGADPACTVNFCLLISTSIPATNSGGGLLGNDDSNAIDLTLTLPQSFNSPDPQNPYTMNATTSSGKLAVAGFNGILNLSGSLGITVSHTIIFAGSCIQVTHGDLTISQNTQFDLQQASPIVPCSNTTDTGSHPWFRLTSGIGNVNVTFPSSSTKLELDAYTNDGEITGNFGLNVSTSNGSASFYGPLLPNTSPTALLYIKASTGNILLQQQ